MPRAKGPGPVAGPGRIVGRMSAPSSRVPGDDAGAARRRARPVPRHDAATAAVLEGVRGGLDGAASGIARDRAAWDSVEHDARLPEVGGQDPVFDLALRLDREADFWRSFAVMRLRPGLPRALAAAAAVVGLGAGASLGVLGGVRGLVSDGSSSAVLMAAALAVAAGVAGALLAAAWLHTGAVSAARDALARAEQAERRLQRVVAVLALRQTSEAAYLDALIRLERVP